MADSDTPQIYLVSPPEIELSRFPDALARVLDAREVACVRLALATREEERLVRAADALREVTAARDVALVIAEHVGLAERLGLDGVHLSGARGVRAARKALGADAIVGAQCGASRHDGMNAGEAGADYVAFGPVSGADLGDGTLAPRELFAWWSEMIELPVVAEGGLDEATVRSLWDVTDFFAFGEEIWGAEDPVARLAALLPG
jgi:thiamine-phosphate pyrophosphorylase